jgi:ADP-ribose pyrophosphatase YjhB (NUDIX family)
VARGHVVVLLDDERVVLLRVVRSGSVSYRAPGVRVVGGETPGHAAARAAREELGIEVEVTDLLFADTESGAEHYFFLAVPVARPDGRWTEPRRSSRDGVSVCAVREAAILGYPVRPPGIARGLHHRRSARQVPSSAMRTIASTSPATMNVRRKNA